MRIPSANLYKMAVRVIGQDAFYYFRYLSRETNQIGYDVSNFDDPILLQGSIQAVPRTAYQAMGLDFNKEYFTFYVPNDFLEVDRDVSGDQIGYAGRQLQCLSSTPWFTIDGWKSILCVVIGPQVGLYETIGFEGEGYFNFDNGNFGFNEQPFPETFKTFGFGDGDWGFDFGNFGA